MSIQNYDLESLSDGIPQMPRRLTARERFADSLFFYLQTISHFTFVIGAIVGYAFKGLDGFILLTGGGFIFGIWMRRSLGIRGPNQFEGFFRRIEERANGSRRGMLEWVIETLRGSGFTISKCKDITKAYEQAKIQLSSASSPDQQKEILKKLDENVKKISYKS